VSIVCLSNSDWGLLRYRKQHLMERLSTRARVVYVNPPRAVKARSLLQRHRTRRAGDRLWVYEPPVLPGARRPSIKSINYRLIARRLARWRTAPFVLWVYSPHAEPFIDLLRPDLVVYDVADLYATPSGPALRGAAETREIETLAALESRLVRRADLLFCVSEPLAGHLRSLGAADPILVPNGADCDRYAHLDGRTAGAQGARPIIGYVGSIAPRMDVGLVAEMARLRPEWRFDVVGPVSPLVDVSAWNNLPNVTCSGGIPYDAVPGRIAGFDVGLLPLHDIPFARYCSPIQVFDYLAAGLPVVSTPVTQLERLGERLVKTARGAAAMVAAVERALADRSASAAAERRAFARSNSWDRRAEAMWAHVTGTLVRKTRLQASAGPEPRFS
jgi:UDP-galactopyranose mutase